MKTQTNLAQDKSDFLDALKSIEQSGNRARAVIERLLDGGVSVAELVRWGIEAGFKEKWTRSVISITMLAKGKRRRRHGRQGPPIPREAITLARQAIRRFQEKAPKILLAASRVAKKELGNRIGKRNSILTLQHHRGLHSGKELRIAA